MAMPPETTHPPADRLKAFAEGRVASEDSSELEQHLLSCETCCGQLATWSDDYLLQLARRVRPADVPPQKIARYEVRALIGKGGMGSVYKAYDPELRRLVAVKVPHLKMRQGTQSVRLARFLRETRAAAQIQHPHVCPVYDVGEDNGAPFVVMAFFEGGSLAEKLRGGGYQDLRCAATLATQVAEALEAVHAHNIVHRDLKAENILLDNSGENAFLGDFGLAASEEASPQLTFEGDLFGTPAYMPPEQALGHWQEVGPWTDLYSLGVVLFQMITGRLPFEADNPVALLRRITTDNAPAPSQFRAGLDQGLEAVVQKAMARNVQERFSTAAEMIASLRTWLTESPRRGAQELPAVLAAAEPDSGSLAPKPNPLPDWLEDVETSSRKGPLSGPTTNVIPDWLEEMRLWFALELGSAGAGTPSPSAQEPAASVSPGSVPKREISGLVEDWKLEILDPQPRSGASARQSGREQLKPSVARQERASAPPVEASQSKGPVSRPPAPAPSRKPKVGKLPVASPLPQESARPAEQPDRRKQPITPRRSPPVGEPPAAADVEALTRKTRLEAGVDLATGRIVEPEKFQEWKKQNSQIGLILQPQAAAARPELSNASVFEIFRKGRLEVDAWVDDDMNVQLVKYASMEEICADADMRRLFARYEAYPKEIQRKLRQHLEFMVQNRRRYYEATGEKLGW